MTNQPSLIPIYTTKGDPEAFLIYPYLFNRAGEWIGWVTPKREVYSTLGNYVGELTKEPRIVRARVMETEAPKMSPPAPPKRIAPPSTVPLPPMMGDLPFSMIDVLLDEPERLHTLDSGEFREDMD
jgi:hypothetical protein